MTYLAVDGVDRKRSAFTLLQCTHYGCRVFLMGGLPSEKNTIIRHGPPKIAPLVVAGGYVGILHWEGVDAECVGCASPVLD